MSEQMTQYNGAGIYAFFNRVNGKAYIGQAQNIAKRIRAHQRRSATERKRLYDAVRKYGWDSFDIVLLECVSDLPLLNDKEKYWIEYFNSTDPRKGYNMVADPEHTMRGYHHTEESRKRIGAYWAGRKRSEENKSKLRIAQRARAIDEKSVAEFRARMLLPEIVEKRSAKLRGRKIPDEARAKMRVAKLGKSLSEQARQKLSAAMKGRPLSEEHKANLSAARIAKGFGTPVLQINKDTKEVIARWPNARQAGASLSILQGAITGCCKGKYGYKTAGGYEWRYEGVEQ